MNRSIGPQHPLAGKTVKLKHEIRDIGSGAVYPAGKEYRVEDDADNIGAPPWREGRTFAALNYIKRAEHQGLPSEGVVLYGKIDFLGYLIHESEVE